VIQQADLGAKGVYQRLRTGPYASIADAKKVCDQLRSRKQRCFIIRGRM
ncbi:MAG TPA: SPOR domain-containing protein, partial [Rhodospirillaceae bacterium]|nr:SPOR domain-containing protein [Rhodospirillaceae bacterium]